MSIRDPTVPSSGDLVAVFRFFFGISDFYTGEDGFVYGWYEWAKGTQQSALSAEALVANMRFKDPEAPKHGHQCKPWLMHRFFGRWMCRCIPAEDGEVHSSLPIQHKECTQSFTRVVVRLAAQDMI